ncbi:hypothetical protein Taro_025994 [Colocasia esculenta]|uniref:Uncharacterized protein n=1 Tax=Colocasia esculenta TaxID=4460 RepID=A0A843VPY6_COLES|nr:hypothetical protein [Colocasia esculenta]
MVSREPVILQHRFCCELPKVPILAAASVSNGRYTISALAMHEDNREDGHQQRCCFDNVSGSTVKWTDDGRKRRRYGDFNRAWELLFTLRWPVHNNQMLQVNRIRGQDSIGDREHMQNIDWQQLYWETHLQNCLDEASEKALLPAFDGCIKEIKVSNCCFVVCDWTAADFFLSEMFSR